jgi:hypothetical protein
MKEKKNVYFNHLSSLIILTLSLSFHYRKTTQKKHSCKFLRYFLFFLALLWRSKFANECSGSLSFKKYMMPIKKEVKWLGSGSEVICMQAAYKCLI